MKITPHVYLVGSSELGISGEGDCHVYLVDAGTELILVDSGDGSGIGEILSQVRREGLDPARISHVFLTHAHRDHAGGLEALRQELKQIGERDIVAVASREEADLLSQGSEEALGLDLIGFAGRSREEVFPRIDVDRIVVNREEIDICHLRFQALIVPGHNPGCVCYFATIDGKNMLFSGDVISCGGYISIGNWPGSNNEQYKSGIKALAGLDVDALFPSHHLFTIRDGQSHIDRAVEAFGGLWPPRNLFHDE